MAFIKIMSASIRMFLFVQESSDVLVVSYWPVWSCLVSLAAEPMAETPALKSK